MLNVRRFALLGVIFGAHVLLFYLISLNDHPPGAQRSDEPPATIFLIDLSTPDVSQPTPRASPKRSISTRDSAPVIDAPDNAISLPPENERNDTPIDWNSEASRVAADAASRLAKQKEPRSLDGRPAGSRPPPPKSSLRQRGDSEHYEGGVIIDWISNRCYYSNQDAHVDAFGPALRLQVPTCTGRDSGAGGAPLPSFDEWKKERDSR